MATSAEIQKYTRHRDGYIEYIIKVIHNGKLWAIRKRFSEFTLLHEHLLKNGYEFDGVLPKKTFWKKNDENKLKKRQRALQDYLDKLLYAFSPSDNSLLKEFFEVESTWLALAKRQSFKEIQYTEKLNKLPRQLVRWMISVPYQKPPRPVLPPSVRGFSNSAQQFMSPGGSAKTKSVSFSSFAARRSDSRKDSFAGGDGSNTPQLPQSSVARDRKFSIDMFNLGHSGNNAEQLASAVKKSAFMKATQILWKHYQEDVAEYCAEANFLRQSSVKCFTRCRPSAPSASSSSSRAATPPKPPTERSISTGDMYRAALLSKSTHGSLVEALERVDAWESTADSTRPRSSKPSTCSSDQRMSLSISLESPESYTASLEAQVGVRVKDMVMAGFAPYRGSSQASAASTASAAESDSGTTVESQSVKS